MCRGVSAPSPAPRFLDIRLKERERLDPFPGRGTGRADRDETSNGHSVLGHLVSSACQAQHSGKEPNDWTGPRPLPPSWRLHAKRDGSAREGFRHGGPPFKRYGKQSGRFKTLQPVENSSPFCAVGMTPAVRSFSSRGPRPASGRGPWETRRAHGRPYFARNVAWALSPRPRPRPSQSATK